MAFQSGIVVELLQSLASELAGPRGLLAEAASAVQAGRFEAALQATDKLRGVLSTLVARYQRLHANVVPIDEFGGAMESIGELVLRARQMVIVTQLGRLRDALREPEAQRRAQGWFVGRFQRIEDVTTFFYNELSTINGLWTQYREHHPQPAGMSSVDRGALYQASVRVAQRALRDLRDHPDVMYLLRAGLAVTDWPEVRAAFAELAAALNIQLEVEPARSLLAMPPAPIASRTP